MLFSEYLEAFSQYLENLEKSPRTVEGYILDLQFFIKWIEDYYNCPAYLEDITLQDIEKFLLMLREERDYKPASRKRVSISIKMFLKYAYKKKLISTDIASEIETIKCPTKEREYLSEEEVMAFVDAVEHKLVQVLILLMYYTGLRISECLSLKVKDVDLEKRKIHVRSGKGAKDRIVPISDKLYDVIVNYNSWRVDSDNFIATEKTGSLSSVRAAAIIRETRKKLGIDKSVTAHTFRHSFASHLVSQNVNIVNISKLLGHSDIKTTSIYTHTDYSQLEQAVNTF